MNDELIFRVIFGFVYLAVFGTVGFVRRTTESRDEKISSRAEEGSLIFIPLRLFGLSGLAVAVLYVFKPQWLIWATLSLPVWLRWTGAVLAAIAIPLAYWSASTLGKNRTSTVAIRKEHELVTSGPYQWVRHPLYSVGVLVYSALALLSASWYIGLVLVVAFVFILFRTDKEEAKLVEHFGDEYVQYMRQTGRFLPLIAKTK